MNEAWNKQIGYNQAMRWKIGFFIACIGLLVSGCTQADTSVPTTTGATPTGRLTPYRTVTPGAVTATATAVMVIPVTPAPTATPFMHTITNDDTMLGIAFKYGISLEELQAANPGVDPHFLSVGKQLVIPIGGEIPETLPTPTAVPVSLDEAQCYKTGEGGAWCFVVVQNELEQDVENISAWVGIFSAQGKNTASKVVFTPLNLLKAGEKMPLMVYFEPPVPNTFNARAELLSAILIAEDDERYLEAEMGEIKVDISTDGSQATVSGTITLPEGAASTSQVWVLAVAYDAEGNVIGARKWESDQVLEFTFAVYSLAGMIDSVDVVSEVRP